MLQYWPSEGKKCVFENENNIISVFPLAEQFFVPEIEKLNSNLAGKSRIEEKDEKKFILMKKQDFLAGKFEVAPEIEDFEKKNFFERKFLLKFFDKKSKKYLPEKRVISLQYTQVCLKNMFFLINSSQICSFFLQKNSGLILEFQLPILSLNT